MVEITFFEAPKQKAIRYLREQLSKVSKRCVKLRGKKLTEKVKEMIESCERQELNLLKQLKRLGDD